MIIYDDLQRAFSFYNRELFSSLLPECVITLQRKGKTKGYFAPDRFINNNSQSRHELAINPEYFGLSSTEKVLSTLVHEMCHLHQSVLQNKCAIGYHNRNWAEDMIRVGLIPSSTGVEGGKQTGFKVSHYIASEGRFDCLTKDLIASGFKIIWKDSRQQKEVTSDKCNVNCKAKKGGKRLKYSCGCSNVWGKPGLSLVCGKCGHDFKPLMVEEKNV